MNIMLHAKYAVIAMMIGISIYTLNVFIILVLCIVGKFDQQLLPEAVAVDTFPTVPSPPSTKTHMR